MQAVLGKFDGVVYSAMRIVLGFLYWCHGPQWLFGWFNPLGPVPLFSLTGVAGLLELTLGTLLMIGLFSRPAAFIASGEMAVAYFYFHLQRGQGWVPVMNGSEITVALCFGFLFIAFHGAGPISIDRLLASWRKSA